MVLWRGRVVAGEDGVKRRAEPPMTKQGRGMRHPTALNGRICREAEREGAAHVEEAADGAVLSIILRGKRCGSGPARLPTPHHRHPSISATPTTTSRQTSATLLLTTNTTTTAMPPQNRTPTDLNYAVLSRYLPRLHQILTTASYAHIYFWSSTSQAWSKANFEGSIFIVSLHPSQPTPSDPAPSQTEEYLLFLLNRSGLDNFSYELRDPSYIDSECGDIMMLRENDPHGPSPSINGDADKDKEVVYGLFVSCEANTSTADDREKLSRAMKECATTFQATNAAATVQTPSPPPLPSPSPSPSPSPPPPPPPPPEEPTLGRQISMMELFRQGGGRGRETQREPQYGHVSSLQVQQRQDQGYYTQSSGWEGIGTGQQQLSLQHQHQHQQQQQQSYYGQQTSSGGVGIGSDTGSDLLMNLFQRASDARFRGGTPTQGQGY